MNRQRVYFESLIFRLREVTQGMFTDGLPQKIILTGGLAARFDFSNMLAALLPVPLYILKEREMSLWGAAWLAGGCTVKPKFRFKQVHPKFEAPWMLEKYPLWQRWLNEVLRDPSMAIPPVYD